MPDQDTSAVSAAEPRGPKQRTSPPAGVTGSRGPRKAKPKPQRAADGDDLKTVKKAAGKLPPLKVLREPLYNHPQYYDWAYSYRDYEVEADFLHDVYEQVTGREPASFVEIGCGPAQHSLEMAESDLTVFCVDNNAGMLEYAQQLAKEDDLKITVIGEDMRTFSLPHMHSNADALQALKRAHNALKPGGVLILELQHPCLLFDGSILNAGDTWSVETDDAQVDVTWGHADDELDSLTQVQNVTIEVDILLRAMQRIKIVDKQQFRHYTHQELSLLTDLAGFKTAALFNSFNLASQEKLLGQDSAAASDSEEELVDTGDEEDLDFERNHNPNKPASAPDYDAQEDYEDDDPLRLLMVLQKPE